MFTKNENFRINTFSMKGLNGMQIRKLIQVIPLQNILFFNQEVLIKNLRLFWFFNNSGNKQGNS